VNLFLIKKPNVMNVFLMLYLSLIATAAIGGICAIIKAQKTLSAYKSKGAMGK
jgi:hypothetical protein